MAMRAGLLMHQAGVARLGTSSRTAFYSLDIEMFERQHNIILEIGWTSFSPGSNKMVSRHFVMKENEHLYNGQYVSNHKYDFNWGTSETCSLDEALIIMAEDMTTTMNAGQEVMLVGHAVERDLEYLVDHGLVLPPNWWDLIMDSQLIASYVFGTKDQISLKRLLQRLGVTNVKNLHNGGNDAKFTMDVFLRLLATNPGQRL
mmetsp:Transcript_10465/g.18285  ORF Transcript_10465/g.18285 Transcript_10465/m.18285 type:complete len:202 (-) Transcript_10465:415-1020(-)|eukprot:CAMPEP_0119105090 /NCGR_PEP_ID=MMETSP1180-20130426/3148_1 /TAXON_ID=3052 ORGANISM="Chlamydomonas cf sp, Strain CCMP681" /NCGR_SAMPLE_ID=MMETSP1180 /ASSEMBLY_ACC=CAM_ASM_000741 /LENGTH=201 /DNA_ID=CAMNT_0007090055 /DNA_START=67 /DNA_END=672 /DNA_ORIENTATION=-